MRITCATIIVSRGLESTAECWTVSTGQRKVSCGRSVDSGGRARPLPTSVGRTLVLCPTDITFLSVEMVKILWVKFLHVHVRLRKKRWQSHHLHE